MQPAVTVDMTPHAASRSTKRACGSVRHCSSRSPARMKSAATAMRTRTLHQVLRALHLSLALIWGTVVHSIRREAVPASSAAATYAEKTNTWRKPLGSRMCMCPSSSRLRRTPQTTEIAKQGRGQEERRHQNTASTTRPVAMVVTSNTATMTAQSLVWKKPSTAVGNTSVSAARAMTRATPAKPIHQDVGLTASARPGRKVTLPMVSEVRTNATRKMKPMMPRSTMRAQPTEGLHSQSVWVRHARKERMPVDVATQEMASTRQPSRRPRYQSICLRHSGPRRALGGWSAHMPVTSSAATPRAAAQRQPTALLAPSQASASAAPSSGPPAVAARGRETCCRCFEALGQTRPATPRAVSQSICSAPHRGISKTSAASTPDRRTNGGMANTR
mmetsp:Transcript_113441/g.275551  ORF Transcript_113441/g.275551 Transcript_113441/m.275551 type:complete len:389 (+) Transcript_113441:468-1634(+)